MFNRGIDEAAEPSALDLRMENEMRSGKSPREAWESILQCGEYWNTIGKALDSFFRKNKGFLPNDIGRDDLLQEVLLEVTKHLGQWAPTGSFAGWLNTVALNRCRQVKRNRSRKSRSPGLFLIPLETDDVVDFRYANIVKSINDKEAWEVVVRAFEWLDSRERTIVLMRFQSGLKSDAIARELRITESRVSQICKTAIQKVQAMLAKPVPESRECETNG